MLEREEMGAIESLEVGEIGEAGKAFGEGTLDAFYCGDELEKFSKHFLRIPS